MDELLALVVCVNDRPLFRPLYFGSSSRAQRASPSELSKQSASRYPKQRKVEKGALCILRVRATKHTIPVNRDGMQTNVSDYTTSMNEPGTITTLWVKYCVENFKISNILIT